VDVEPQAFQFFQGPVKCVYRVSYYGLSGITASQCFGRFEDQGFLSSTSIAEPVGYLLARLTGRVRAAGAHSNQTTAGLRLRSRERRSPRSGTANDDVQMPMLLKRRVNGCAIRIPFGTGHCVICRCSNDLAEPLLPPSRQVSGR
jgi:hypothetical protein